MARNVEKRLQSLRQRRTGSDRLERLNEDSRREVIAKAATVEKWQERAAGQPNTRYALGAMQEVGSDYTRICLETATRVGEQLEKGLTDAGIAVDFRLQGSVPLNVHIRGVSDVDLLNLRTDFCTYDRNGAWSRAGIYTSPSSRTSAQVLTELRRKAIEILKAKYPAATVDTSGGKAIAIYGGSLARPVDVVPSHWDDNARYQFSGQEYDRGVTILNAKTAQTIDNLPFLHIKLVTDACNETAGGLRKAIRMAKSLKADAISEGTQIDLPSFDVAALMYHADRAALRSGALYELNILGEAHRHLDSLARNRAASILLETPDGTRRILDTDAKWRGLIALTAEFEDLLKEVAKEQDYLIGLFGEPSPERLRGALAKIV